MKVVSVITLLLFSLISCGPKSNINNVIIIGDSLSCNDSWPYYFKKYDGIKCEVLAKIGANSYHMVNWIVTNRDFNFKNYDCLILLGGINDYMSYDISIRQLSYILQMAKKYNPNIVTVVVEYPKWNTYAKWDKNKEEKVDSVQNYLRIYPGLTDIFVTNILFSPEYQIDGLHLNEKGKQLLASNIYYNLMLLR